MVSPAEQKAFLDALFARGALPFEDVVLLLGRRGKPPAFAALAQALEFLRNEGLFRIVHVETGQEVALDEAVFAQADRHALHLLGIEEKECLMAREHAPRIIADKVDVIEDKYRWASVEARNFVKIVGDKRAQRRGEGRFELVSVSTPNGLAIHCVDVRIAIIDESQRFRICGLAFAKA